MGLSLDDLFSAVTVNQATQSVLDIGTALGFNVTAWQSGRAGRTLIAIVATIYSGFTVVAVQVARGGFRETATGGWLTILSKQMYDVDRNVASHATGFVTLTNGAAVPYTFSPQGLTLTNSTTKASYTNTYDAGIYGALPGIATLLASGTLTIPVEALVPGTASNAAPTQIDTLNPNLLEVTVSNALPVLGADDESDPALQARDLDRLGSLSPNGHVGAYLYWALSVRKDGSGNPVYPPPVGAQDAYDAATALDIVRAKVVQALDLGALYITAATNASPIAIATAGAHNIPDGAGVVISGGLGNTAMNGRWQVSVTGQTTFTLNGSAGNGVYSGQGVAQAALLTLLLATADAPASSGDIAIVDGAVQAYVVPAGDTEVTAAPTIVTIPITYSAELDPAFGIDPTTAQNTIDAALVAWFADVRKNPIGAKSKTQGGQPYVFVKVLESVIIGALPAAGLAPAILDADISIPAADVAVNATQLAAVGTITPTINSVPQN